MQAKAVVYAEKPDLAALSVGLPAGWKALWDSASKELYYGCPATKVNAPVDHAAHRAVLLLVLVPLGAPSAWWPSAPAAECPARVGPDAPETQEWKCTLGASCLGSARAHGGLPHHGWERVILPGKGEGVPDTHTSSPGCCSLLHGSRTSWLHQCSTALTTGGGGRQALLQKVHAALPQPPQ